MMEECDKLLKKYDINFCDEFFYLLLHFINSNIASKDDLLEAYKKEKNFEELKRDYSIFYEKVENFLNSIDLDKELMMHQKVLEMVAYFLDNYYETLQKKIKVYISNVLDVVFVKYKLDFSNLKTNEDIKNYLLDVFKNENIVNPLMLILLADTSLTEEYVENISYDEFENLLVNLILLILYLHKDEK